MTARLSGELLLFLRWLSGTRAGIFEGDLICEDGAALMVVAAACGLLVAGLLPVGVLAFDLGAGAFMTLAGRAGWDDFVVLLGAFMD